MRSQQLLRDELRFVTEFGALFDVIQQVAVSQLRRSDEALRDRRHVMDLVERDYFPLLPASARGEWVCRGGTRGRLLVVVTSDEGMVGPLHAEVIRHAHAQTDDATQWILVGQRGTRLVGAAGPPRRVMPIPAEEHAEEQMRRLGQVVMSQFRREQLQDARLVAARFLSPTRQDVVTHRLLPLPVPWSQAAVGREDVVIEPSVGLALEQLAALWVETVCIEAFWSARRAEFAARALHMEAARQELTKRSRRLRHEFFKAAHERVDVMVRETCVVQRLSARRSHEGQAGLSARRSHEGQAQRQARRPSQPIPER